MGAEAMKKVNESMKRPSVSPKVRELLGQISGFDNIPRKKAKFQNWMKNSLKIHNTMLLEQVWDIFAEASMNDPPGAQPPKQPLNQVAQPCAEVSGRSPPESPAEPAEAAKKNKRERKEERQKGRKKEKKELKVEAQENAGRRKPKRAQGQEDGAGAEAPATNGVAPGKKAKKKRERAQGPGEGAASGAGGPREHSAGKRKRKHSEGEADCKKKKMKLPEPPEQEVTPVKGKFNWKGTIKAVLKQAPDNEIAVKKLKKKVLAQYYSVASEQHRSEEELLVIFNKKISKNPAFRVLKDKVKLLK
ncbi:cell growth-regulating nucleolar protein isoform X2 [Tenrec ecaudatus]|uniref:cell growth-regulating nucleolar protein isoform X2 n=1 Tax=Tenrec ecaudatus TaxID=94439 RepID=UPI003F59E1D1